MLGILTSRLIIAEFGTAAYAQYGLLATIPTLLPFADLGIAAVVINAVAGSDDPARDDTVRRTVVTAFRILLVSSAILVAVAAVITLAGWWPALLGEGLMPGAAWVPFLCLVLFGLALPLTVGQRILVGLGRTTTQVASQAVVAPFMFVSIGTCALLALPVGAGLSALSYVGNALVSVICLVVVARVLRPQLGEAVRLIPHPRRYRGVRAVHLAWPMLVQMIALPMAMQTDRLLLSHLAGPGELAQYNLASQLFGLILQTIAASGVALWPIFAAARSADRVESPWQPTLAFLGMGVVLGLVLAVLSPWLAAFVSAGRITLDFWLLAGFVLFVALQAVKYPLGMYMTDQRGLRFQVAPILVMVPVNLALSWWLTLAIGPGGPIIGSAVAVLVCQVVPNLLYVRADLARRRQQQATTMPAPTA
ncbi:polysaccharide biosynthesis protein [Tersicoccus sp. Bi-70]|nr:polysaccharide biosynthesis protein [Tersicoccus sp. Bi-70]